MGIAPACSTSLQTLLQQQTSPDKASSVDSIQPMGNQQSRHSRSCVNMPRISAQEVDDVYDASAETSQVSNLIKVRETRQKYADKGSRRQETPSTPLSTNKTRARKRVHVQDVRRTDRVQKRASPRRTESLKDVKAKSTRRSDLTKHVFAADTSGHGIGAQKTTELNAYHDVASHDQKVRKGTPVKVSTLPLLNPGQQGQLIAWPASNENLAANHLQFPLGEHIDCESSKQATTKDRS